MSTISGGGAPPPPVVPHTTPPHEDIPKGSGAVDSQEPFSFSSLVHDEHTALALEEFVNDEEVVNFTSRMQRAPRESVNKFAENLRKYGQKKWDNTQKAASDNALLAKMQENDGNNARFLRRNARFLRRSLPSVSETASHLLFRPEKVNIRAMRSAVASAAQEEGNLGGGTALPHENTQKLAQTLGRFLGRSLSKEGPSINMQGLAKALKGWDHGLSSLILTGNTLGNVVYLGQGGRPEGEGNKEASQVASQSGKGQESHEAGAAAENAAKKTQKDDLKRNLSADQTDTPDGVAVVNDEGRGRGGGDQEGEEEDENTESGQGKKNGKTRGVHLRKGVKRHDALQEALHALNMNDASSYGYSFLDAVMHAYDRYRSEGEGRPPEKKGKENATDGQKDSPTTTSPSKSPPPLMSFFRDDPGGGANDADKAGRGGDGHGDREGAVGLYGAAQPPSESPGGPGGNGDGGVDGANEGTTDYNIPKALLDVTHIEAYIVLASLFIWSAVLDNTYLNGVVKSLREVQDRRSTLHTAFVVLQRYDLKVQKEEENEGKSTVTLNLKNTKFTDPVTGKEMTLWETFKREGTFDLTDQAKAAYFEGTLKATKIDVLTDLVRGPLDNLMVAMRTGMSRCGDIMKKQRKAFQAASLAIARMASSQMRTSRRM